MFLNSFLIVPIFFISYNFINYYLVCILEYFRLHKFFLFLPFFVFNFVLVQLEHSAFSFLAGVVQQKVLGIIPSSTAGGSQTYTTFQPRTTTLNIKPNTPGSQQQVRIWVQTFVLFLFLLVLLLCFMACGTQFLDFFFIFFFRFFVSTCRTVIV